MLLLLLVNDNNDDYANDFIRYYARISVVPLTTLGPPVIVKFEEQRKVNLGEMVQVKCAAIGHPLPKIHMTFNTRSVEDAEDVTVTSQDSETEIEFKALRNSTVFCKATNEFGRDKRKMKILVQRK